MVQATYTLTRADLMQFLKACTSRPNQVRPWLQRVSAGFMGCVGVLGLVTVVFPSGGAAAPQPVFYLFVYFALVVLAAHSLWQHSRWRLSRWLDTQVRSGVYVLGDYAIIVDAEGAEEITPKGRTKVAWRDVSELSQDDGFIYMVYHGANSGSGFVTPKRAFTTPQAASAFHDAAVTYWRAARDNAAVAQAAEQGVWPPPPRRTV